MTLAQDAVMRTTLFAVLIVCLVGLRGWGQEPAPAPAPPEGDAPPAPVNDEGPSTVGSGGRFGD